MPLDWNETHPADTDREAGCGADRLDEVEHLVGAPECSSRV